jgi:RNA polymerase sigma-70 factor (ECF subfamily)
MNRKLHINEQLLIDVLYANNRQAFSFVYDTFSPVLHGSIIDLIETDKECASHVLEDGFSIIWEALQYYDERQQKLFAWLLHMMHQLATVALRQLNRWPATEVLERLSIGLRQKLLTMNPEQRRIIELIYEKGYSKARISQALHISVEIVDQLLQAGLQHLKQYIKTCSLD